MAKKPLDQRIDLLEVDVKIDGSSIDDSIRIMNMEIVNEVNKIPYAILQFLDGNAAEETFELSESKTFLPGNEVSISLGYHQETTEIFKGIIVNHRIKIGSGHPRLVIKCFDKAIKMTADRKSTYFLKMKDGEVMSQLIANAGLQKEVQATQYQHKELIQYHASDWDFLLSRADMNGLVVVVENGKVSVKEPDVSASPTITLTYGTDISKIDLDIDSNSQLKAVECSSWDPNTQKIVTGASSEPSVNEQGNLTGKKLSEVVSSTDYLLQSPAQIETGMLKAWANARLLKSRLARMRGTITFVGLEGASPNSIIEINGVGDRFNGKAYITGLTHEISDGTWETTAKIGLSPNWFSETQQDIVVPPAGGVLPGIEGLHVGIVRKIHEDPDGEYRVHVDVPTIAESGDGVWARMTNLYATKKPAHSFILNWGMKYYSVFSIMILVSQSFWVSCIARKINLPLPQMIRIHTKR